MLSELITNKVYYKIFDKTYQQSTHIYAKHKAQEAAATAEITRNLAAVKREFTSRDILILQQVHGNLVVDADNIDNLAMEPIGDSAITTKKDLILTVQTADCVPLLFADLTGEIIGVAHAGWKSAKADIVLNLVSAMKDKGASAIKVVAGPCIGLHAYEVEQNYYQSFIELREDYSEFFIPSLKSSHYLFDLLAFVELKIQEAGVVKIIKINEDTYTLEDKYPSYRRACHMGSVHNQHILSALVIK